MDKPSEKLAEQIIDRLVKEKLISKSSGEKMRSKLADGTLRPEDWRLPIEIGNKDKPKA